MAMKRCCECNELTGKAIYRPGPNGYWRCPECDENDKIADKKLLEYVEACGGCITTNLITGETTHGGFLGHIEAAMAENPNFWGDVRKYFEEELRKDPRF